MWVPRGSRGRATWRAEAGSAGSRDSINEREQLSKSARGLVHFLGIRYCRETFLTGVGGTRLPLSVSATKKKRGQGSPALSAYRVCLRVPA